MYIEEIVLDGFKSYSGRTVINGFDKDFNAITGLNGTGKSNILDSICFVLGITNLKQIRVNTVLDLIYKRGKSHVNRCSVTLVFNNEDSDMSPVGFGDEKRISVSRQVFLDGKSKYLINGVTTQQNRVEAFFQSCNLNINNPHFLIMQGQITKILNMKPPEIRGLIEEVSGTKMYEDRKERAMKTIDKKDGKMKEINSILEDMVFPKLKKLKYDRKSYLEYQIAEKELSVLRRKLISIGLRKNKTKRDKIIRNLKDNQEELDDQKIMVENLEKKESELKRLHEHLQDIDDERKRVEIELDSKVVLLESLKSQMEIKEKRLTECIHNQKHQKESVLVNIGMESNEPRRIDKDLECELEMMLKQYKHLHSEYKKTHGNLETLSNELLTGIQIDNKGFGIPKFLKEQELNLIDFQTNTKRKENQIYMVENEVCIGEDDIKEIEMRKSTVIKNLTELKEKEKVLKSHLRGDMKKSSESIMEELSRLSNTVETEARFKHSSMKGILGSIIELIHIDEKYKCWFMSIETLLGNKLLNLVSTDEKVAAKILESESGSKRISVMPLNKILVNERQFDSNKDLIDKLKGLYGRKVIWLFDIMEYQNKDIEKIAKFLFGSILLCSDKELARKIAFEDIRSMTKDNTGIKVLTEDTDILDPSGLMIGGSNQSHHNKGGFEKKSLILEYKRYTEIVSQYTCLKEELTRVRLAEDKERRIEEEISEIHGQIDIQQEELNSLNDLEHNKLEKKKFLDLLKKEVSVLKNVEDHKKDVISHISNMDEFGVKQSLEAKLTEFSGYLQDYKKKVLFYENMKNRVSTELKRKNDLDKDIEMNILSLNDEISLLNHKIKELSCEIKKKESIRTSLAIDFHQNTNHHKELAENTNDLHLFLSNLKELENKIKRDKHMKKDLESEFEMLLKDNEDILGKDVKDDGDLYEKMEEICGQDDLDVVCEETLNAKFNELNGVVSSRKKFINYDVMEMLDDISKQENTLIGHLKTIENDKLKINETIVKLNTYKNDKMKTTFDLVNKYFGEISSTLLQDCSSRLDPSDDGFQIRVCLNGVWKKSLGELSGGQRSLIALSLIFTLLKFQPAPFYILDEVDSALDLSHTQNIGKLIKHHFNNSQFIVVSLKDGLFDNANVVFRTNFSNGTSNVVRTQNLPKTYNSKSN